MQASNIKSCSLINKIFVRKNCQPKESICVQFHSYTIRKINQLKKVDMNGNSVNKSIISQWGESCWATTSIKLFILFALTARF
jgi:hypothetical protein